MKYIVVITALVFFLVSTYHAQCQGIFVPKGANGFGIQETVGVNDNSIGFGTAIGASLKGMFDFGFSLEYLDLKERILETVDLSAIGIGPSLAIHLVKTNGLCAAFSVAYERVVFSGNKRRVNVESLHSNTVAAGISFYHFKPRSQNVNIVPVLSLSAFSTELVKDGESHFSDIFVGSFEFNISIKHKTHNSIFISPDGFKDDDGNLGFTISIGYIFLNLL